MVVKGYWQNEEATAREFSDGFWHSGDVGALDAHGYVQVRDRKKDMINRGGYKVYSAEVEAVLAEHPAVVESAVIGFPCPVLGERVRAVVTISAPVEAEALRAFCASRLPDYKVPEAITTRSDPLPRNANGKVLKRELRV
jgi:acyl-CoA synthetase (AMP-forming)/AMP-acid ligase II